MKLKIKYNPELGMEDFISNPISADTESPMSIFLLCQDGKKRNATATLEETVRSLFFATRGLFNIFNSDISQIEIDDIKGLKPASIIGDVNTGHAVFKSRYKVCNWLVSLGKIDEFYYMTQNEDKSEDRILYKQNFADSLRKVPEFSKYISNENIISNKLPDGFRDRLYILSAALRGYDKGLTIRIENNVFVYIYKGKRITSMEEADKYIVDEEAYTVFLFLQLMLNSIVNYSRFDMIYIDAKDMSLKTLKLFRIISEVLKQDMSNLDQSISLIFYNLSNSQIKTLNREDKYSQIVELPNSRDMREQSNRNMKELENNNVRGQENNNVRGQENKNVKD